MGVRVALILSLLFVVSCTAGHCRRKAESPEMTGAGAADAAAKATANSESVFVYKYDGSLQCGKGNAESLDAMAKELAGIPILSSAKKSDRLMHIQACGSITGMANVYEIASKHLKSAEAKGFKKWSFE